MELALLVWGVSVLNNLSTFLGVGTAILGFATVFCTLTMIDEGPKMWKWAVPLIITLSLINTIIPSEKTAYVMIGAYAAQKIATDPKAEQIGAKVLVIINKELDKIIVGKPIVN